MSGTQLENLVLIKNEAGVSGEDGFEAALERKPREKPPREVMFDGAFEARLIALACSDVIKVHTVMDNLNTHSIASLYETFEPREPRHPAE